MPEEYLPHLPENDHLPLQARSRIDLLKRAKGNVEDAQLLSKGAHMTHIRLRRFRRIGSKDIAGKIGKIGQDFGTFTRQVGEEAIGLDLLKKYHEEEREIGRRFTLEERQKHRQAVLQRVTFPFYSRAMEIWTPDSWMGGPIGEITTLLGSTISEVAGLLVPLVFATIAAFSIGSAGIIPVAAFLALGVAAKLTINAIVHTGFDTIQNIGRKFHRSIST